jgi:uncharacterized protein (DUF3084 family)
MALQLGALRSALTEAGASKERAEEASEEVAGYEVRLTRLTTMVQVAIGVLVVLLGSQAALWSRMGELGGQQAALSAGMGDLTTQQSALSAQLAQLTSQVTQLGAQQAALSSRMDEFARQQAVVLSRLPDTSGTAKPSR